MRPNDTRENLFVEYLGQEQSTPISLSQQPVAREEPSLAWGAMVVQFELESVCQRIVVHARFSTLNSTAHGFRVRATAFDTLDPAIIQSVMDGYSFAWVRLKHLQEKAAEHWLGKCVEHPTARGIVIAVYFSIGVLFHKLFPASKEARIVRVITCCFLPWRTLKE